MTKEKTILELYKVKFNNEQEKEIFFKELIKKTTTKY